MKDFNKFNYSEIIDDITLERQRQDFIFGKDRRMTPIQWLPALMEEVGEFATEICEGRQYRDNMRTELVQIAALTIAIIQDLDFQETECSE